MNALLRWPLTMVGVVLFSFLQAQCDLALSLTVANEQAAIFQNVTYTLTLSNSGPATATGIKVKAPDAELNANYGLVFTSANPSRGNYNLFTQIWSIDSLKANQSATLTLVLFTLKPDRPTFFAEVVAVNQTDPDSTPGNGNPNLSVQEDDEVVRRLQGLPCDFVINIAEDTCFQPGTSNATYGFKLLLQTTNPAIQFVEVATNPNFINPVSILATNTVSGPFGGWFLQPTGVSNKYYFRPHQGQGCVKEYEVQVPVNCSDSSPTPPDCILGSYFPDIYCINNGQDLALTVSLQTPALYTTELTPTTQYRVILGPTVLGTGTVQGISYFGLTGAKIPVTDDETMLRIERLPDGRCISEFRIVPSNFCQNTPVDFCPQQGIFPWDEWIKRVQLGNLDRSSGKSQFTNFTFENPAVPGNSASVVAGDSVPFRVTVGYSFVAYTDYISMFLDVNRNGTFSQDELVYSGQVPTVPNGANTQSVLMGKVYIPADAQSGVTTMKVVLRRGAPATVCGTVPYGEVELYSVRIGGGINSGGGCADVEFEVLGVECNDNGTPSIAADDTYFIRYLFNQPGFEGTPTFSGAFWVDASGNFRSPPLSSNFVNQGIVGQPSEHGPISIRDFPQLNFRVLGGFCNSDYTLVQAPDNTCSTQGPPIATVNCNATSSFPWEDWISRVRVGNFSKNSGKDTYSDFTKDSITLQIGSNSFGLRASYSYLTYDEYVRVWIDFNRNNIFDANEVAYEGILTKPANGVPFKDLLGQITVPSSTSSGPARMRVRMSRFDYPVACGVQAYGEVEDYTVKIVAGLGLQSSGQQPLPIFVETNTGFYPNPAADKLWLNFDQNSEATVTIRDAFGREVIRREFERTGIIEELSLDGLMNGYYLLQIEKAGERQRTQILVIAKDY